MVSAGYQKLTKTLKFKHFFLNEKQLLELSSEQ